MKLTVLFDLDGTLLVNDMATFLPPYLKALGQSLAPLPGEQVGREVLAATRRMVHKQEPAATLEETFDQNFYPRIGISKQELRPTIDAFYAQVFPSLRQYTQPRPEAIRLVEAAFEMGHQVVVATNPLFPRTAVLQRLEWASLPADRYPFALITTYEHMHFAKPNPAY
ncbi:MAG: HAD family hydrolase, partial [Chloroflexi bacterium]|nr:HAD family hydrolase [Chloroflexota bacterium]